MGWRNLSETLKALDAAGQLATIDREIDPHLEAAAIQRRVYEAGGPALFFPKVKGCAFPMASNLFGTIERTRFLFRDTQEAVRHLVELKIKPPSALRNPWRYRDVPSTALHLLPRRVSRGPILAHQTRIDRLPKLQSWPDDGGPFVTLPQVYSEHPDRPGFAKSNLGMYRVQLSGNDYEPESRGRPALPDPSGAGRPPRRRDPPGRIPPRERVRRRPARDGRRRRHALARGPAGIELRRRPGRASGADGRRPAGGLPMPAEADFAIVGTIDPDRRKAEGPFGDHLGYYSLAHDFPVLRVERVYHREGAIWPFTSVGRPPQEDTSFGMLIHELTGPLVPSVLPGVHEVHAVDAAGVHPLLLAIGSERYVPYADRRSPQELLTQANAILGQGQMSLAKYLLIVAKEDDTDLDIHDIPSFLRHLLGRVDWRNDLHFQTRTTMDTLDYSGTGLNRGSKVVIAAAGPRRRDLPTEVPGGLRLPDGFHAPRLALPGILVVQGPTFRAGSNLRRFCEECGSESLLSSFPLIVVVDDSEFAARTARNFLWVTFTRSDPAADIDGVGASTHRKHWGCEGPLAIDARIKPHHAPPLVDDPEIERRVDALGAPGGPLHGII